MNKGGVIKKRLSEAFLLFLVCFFLATTTSAQEHYVVGVEDQNYLPFFGFEGGELTGFARALFDAIGQDLNVEFEFQALAPMRLDRALEDGSIDLRFPDNPSWHQPQRDNRPFLYSQTVAHTYVSLLVTDLDILAKPNLLIGVPNGFVMREYQEMVRSGRVNLIYGEGLEGHLQRLATRRLDAIYGDILHVRALRETLNLGVSLVQVTSMPGGWDHYYISGRADNSITSAVHTWVEENGSKIKAMWHDFGLIDENSTFMPE